MNFENTQRSCASIYRMTAQPLQADEVKSGPSAGCAYRTAEITLSANRFSASIFSSSVWESGPC
jgi:hypothetical protein